MSGSSGVITGERVLGNQICRGILDDRPSPLPESVTSRGAWHGSFIGWHLTNLLLFVFVFRLSLLPPDYRYTPLENMTIPPENDVNSVIDGRLYIGRYLSPLLSPSCATPTRRRSLQVALSPSQRSGLGITHVLSVCPEYPAEPEDSHHLCIPVQDSEFENLLVHLPIACRFIQDALDAGGKVLVHCVMGVSRSATVVCAYRKSPHPTLRSFVSLPLPALSNENSQAVRYQSDCVSQG